MIPSSATFPAYLERGSVWMQKQHLDRAVDDFTVAIKLQNNYLMGEWAGVGEATRSVLTNWVGESTSNS